MKALRNILILAFALALTTQPGCDWEDLENEVPIDYCKKDQGDIQLPATWTLTSLQGSGSRSQCTDDDYNKKFEFELAVPIQMTQVIENGITSYTGSYGSKFEIVDVQIEGRCIKFTTIETLSADNIVYRTFDGHFDDYEETINGTFIGTGPAHCDVHGTFKAVID